MDTLQALLLIAFINLTPSSGVIPTSSTPKAFPTHIECQRFASIEEKKLVFNYWKKGKVQIKMHPCNATSSLTFLIIYPCEFISATVAFYNRSSSDDVTITNHDDSDKQIKEIIDNTTIKHENKRCAISVVHKNILESQSQVGMCFEAEAKWIGVGRLAVYVLKDNEDISTVQQHDATEVSLPVRVNPPKYKFGVFPTMGIFIGMSFNIFGFSLTLNKADIVPYFQNPTELVFLAVSQFAIWPGLAMVLNLLLDPPSHFQFTFLALTAASSGAITNLFSILTRARLNLNILSLIMWPVLGIGFVPLWVHTLGFRLLATGHPSFDHASIRPYPWILFFALKALFIVPGILGLIGNRFFPKQARILSMVVRPIAILFVFSMMMMALCDHYWSLVYISQWRIVLGPLLLPTVGGLIIFLVSLVVVRNSKTALTLTIQTITPNPAYALLFSITMLPKPYNSVCVFMVIIYVFTTISVTTLTASVLILFRHFHKRESFEIESGLYKEKQKVNTLSSCEDGGIRLDDIVSRKGVIVYGEVHTEGGVDKLGVGKVVKEKEDVVRKISDSEDGGFENNGSKEEGGKIII